MSTLSSLLLQRGLASESAVDEATQRKALHGADLATNLLDVQAASEDLITGLLAESQGVMAAPIGRLEPADPAVLRLIPGELAFRHGFFPLLVDTSILVVAAAEPLPSTVEEDLSFALGVGLRQLAAPLVRVRQAIAGYYGIPLDRRMQRILARLEGRPDPSPTTPPPADPSLVGVVEVPLPAPLPAPASAVQTVPSAGASAGLAKWVRRAVREEKGREDASGPERPAWQRRKGPFTATMAQQELEGALATDVVLDVVFAFARQFFELSLLFTVHGDTAEGRDVAGLGLMRFDATSMSVSLRSPSTLALARERRTPVVAPLSSDGIDGDLMRDLGRPGRSGRRRAAAAVIPIVVKNRVVALLYGDDGDEPVTLSALDDVIAVTSLAAAALERLILRKKQAQAAQARAIPPPPPSSSTSAALAGGAYSVVPGVALPHAATDAPSTADRRSASTPDIEVGWTSQLPPPLVLPPRDTLPVASMPGAVSFDEGDTYAGMGPDIDLASARALLSRGGDARVGDARAGDARSESRNDLLRGEEESPTTVPDAGGLLSTPPPIDSTPRLPSLSGIPGLHSEDDEIDPEWWSRTSRHEAARPSSRGSSRGFDVPSAIGGGGARRSMGKPVAHDDADSDPPTRPLAKEERPDTDAPYARSAPLAPSAPPPAPSAPDLPALLADVLSSLPGSGAAFLKLVEHGEDTLPLLMASFPGPLVVDRQRAGEKLPPASRCGPALELMVAIGHAALPYVIARSGSPDVEIRFWATHLLGELWFTEASSALLPRLFDEDLNIRRIARKSAAALASEGGPAATPIIQGLSHMTRNIDEPTRRRVLAIDTMGEIRVGAMVPPLISALGDLSEDVVDSARRALLFITRQDFELDAKRWLAWWAASSSRHRIEWLIDALMHDDPTIRRAAGDELKQITHEYFGYYDDLPVTERERAQGHYRAWWESEGRARFAPV